jgi:Flp pilus assembly protein TadG
VPSERNLDRRHRGHRPQPAQSDEASNRPIPTGRPQGLSRRARPRTAPHRRGPIRDGDAGSVAVEVTLLAPAMVALLLFVVAAGRMTSARLAVQEAAQQAARTLTLARNPATASDQARSAAIASTSGKQLPCQQVTITINVPTPAAPGSATPAGTGTGLGVAFAAVRLSCTVTLADLTGLSLPSTTVITATATSPLDRFKGST